eukprot:TRINITY_DN2206_c0_g1_i1.p1 TRINITY_DN2206_c0_g1~~TRINITY_DN2206_c0_g1_i1.p1  ORF type:complete len:434 (+),score=99.48 TRINITY_DN2206_c0_g1_i1:268-1569(+)
MSESAIKYNSRRTQSAVQSSSPSTTPMNMQVDLMSSTSQGYQPMRSLPEAGNVKKSPSDGLDLENLLADDLFLFELSDEETREAVELAQALSGDELASSGTSSPALTPYDSKPDPFDFKQLAAPSGATAARAHVVPASAESPAKAVKPLQRGGSLDTLFEAKQRTAEAWPANPTAKPPYSFPCLIGMAMLHHNNTPVAVADLYSYILKRYPYFETAKSGWKNSIRHNLSLNKYFLKVEREVPDVRKGSLWAMVPGKEDDMRRDIENCRVRHERKLAGLSPRVRKRRSSAARRASSTLSRSTSSRQSPSPSSPMKSNSYSPMPLQAHYHQRSSGNTPTSIYQQQLPVPPMHMDPVPCRDYDIAPGPMSRRATEPVLGLMPSRQVDDFLYSDKSMEPWGAADDLFAGLDTDAPPTLRDYVPSLDIDLMSDLNPTL